jgi:hypothetical protein
MGTVILVASMALAMALPFRAHPQNAGALPRGFGAVEGQVIDAQSQPVSGAKVYATDLAAFPGRLPSTRTDRSGRFFLGPLPVGRTTLHASKEAAGYPDTFFAFFDQGSEGITQLQVRNQKVEQGVVVRLGPKGGRLEGQIVDAKTGRPLVAARIALTRIAEPKKFINLGPDSADGRFSVVVPAVAFSVTVSAKGYERWDYGKPLELASGEVKKLRIALHPSKK